MEQLGENMRKKKGGGKQQTNVPITELHRMERCREDVPEHYQIDPSLLERIEEFVNEVDQESSGDGVSNCSIARKDDDSTQSFVEEKKGDEVDEGQV
jgi:hypothetical protein